MIDGFNSSDFLQEELWKDHCADFWLEQPLGNLVVAAFQPY
jgi:hypothetical protein